MGLVKQGEGGMSANIQEYDIGYEVNGDIPESILIGFSIVMDHRSEVLKQRKTSTTPRQ